jgi:circadian clock protein KaiB
MKTKYIFKIFVKGRGRQTESAIENSRRICELTAGKDYRLTIRDLNEESPAGEADDVLAVPLLMRVHPLPIVRMIGELSETEEIASYFKKS